VDLATESSLNDSMGKATKHYSSLFFLPSFRKTLAFLALSMLALSLLTAVLFPTIEGLIYGLLIGLSLLILTLLSDFTITHLVFRKDPIFVIRRTAALSLYSWILWQGFIALGIALGFVFGTSFWVKLSLLGYAAVMTLRAVVFFSVSAARPAHQALASLLQPIFCIIPFLIYWVTINQISLLQVLPFLIVTPFLSLASANLLVSLIDRLGQASYGVPAMPLFRAFMLNWVAGLNSPIEHYFEKLGEDDDVEVSLLEFEAKKTKAAIIVPLVHPGPFKNIGSSHLPSLLKHEFQNAFGGDACVPLGILGHELDLASQTQNQKIIASVISSAKSVTFSDRSNRFVKVEEGFVTASCQVFGDTALLSFSLAPKTTEDLPQELGRFVQEEARVLGLSGALVINAHNCITDLADMDTPLDALKSAASKCLRLAVHSPPSLFEVGAATVCPQVFSLKDGMGTGGITVIAVRLAEQCTAYIVIDGNNMISGLREKILSTLTSAGFDDGEIFTTDTHAVNALVLGRRGYHPVGESMNHETLLNYIKEAASIALKNLENCRVGSLTIKVPRVRVIGEARIRELSILIDKALQRAKQVAPPIFALEGFLLILLLAVL